MPLLVDLLIRFVRWLVSLFGGSATPALSAGERERRRNDALRGMDELEGAEHVHVHGTGPGAKVLRSEPGAQLVEEGGTALWVDAHDKDVPRASWVDVWGPLAGPQGLVDFIAHELEFNEKQLGDPLAAEAELKGFGYASVGQFFAVRITVLKHHGSPTGPQVGDCVVNSQEYATAAMQAHRRRHELQTQAKLKSSPELVAPIEGVTVEVYAQLGARAASLPQDQFQRVLAEHRLDLPAWHRVNAAWTERMSRDTTGTLASVYGQAFMHAGQGQYGGHLQAAAAQDWSGSAAAGSEPMPFDKVCEIAGALSAWGKSGQDVNTLLDQHFGMSAVDWSGVSMWWMTQMTADLRKLEVYNQRLEQWEKQYLGAPARRDQDIQF
jgi:hypothetical protein